MRSLVIPAAIALVTVSVACGGGTTVTFPAVAPVDVEVIPQGQRPSQEFVKMRETTVEKLGSATSDQLISEALSEAAAIGADALLIESVRRDPSDYNPRIVLLSWAIYYPSRHPDAGNN